MSSSWSASAAASRLPVGRRSSAVLLLVCVVIASHLSSVDVSHYGVVKSPTIVVYQSPTTSGLDSAQICELYGGSCVAAGSCSTVHLYGQYRHSILICNSTTICCLSALNFYSLYGHVKTFHVFHRRRRRRRRRRYRKPWRRNYW